MITTATVYTYLFIHLGVILVVTAYYALSASLAPQITDRARLRFARRPWLPTILGLVISVPWVIASLVLLNLPFSGAKFAGATIGLAWILIALIGGAAIAQHVGRGSIAANDSWLHTVRGGLLITLTWVLPLVGWLIVLPLTMATGVGCLVLGLLPMRGATTVQAQALAA